MGPGVSIVGAVRPAAFEYLGGRNVIMFGSANEFWRPLRPPKIRGKTPDQSQADKRRSGNLGR